MNLYTVSVEFEINVLASTKEEAKQWLEDNFDEVTRDISGYEVHMSVFEAISEPTYKQLKACEWEGIYGEKHWEEVVSE